MTDEPDNGLHKYHRRGAVFACSECAAYRAFDRAGLSTKNYSRWMKARASK